MLPIVTAHPFCASWVWSEIFGFLKEFAYEYKGVRGYEYVVDDHVEKVDL